jgi:AcrR family transcriptional regulator
LSAAARLFAERGFHATSVRDIAERAGANVASGNYHYGSKKALYLEVLREQFHNVRSELRRSGGAPAPGELARLTRKGLEHVLRLRVATMLKLMLGPPPSLHGSLMQREMCDPSEALPVIVDEFIVPMTDEMSDIVARIFPQLRPRGVELCVNSLVRQVLFYRFTMPVARHLQRYAPYPARILTELAEHITEFSLGGAERRAKIVPRGRRAK